jgi:hypothetical protein
VVADLMHLRGVMRAAIDQDAAYTPIYEVAERREVLDSVRP